jgi:hypothetical protein
MNLKRFLLLFVVTCLTLAGGATVTTPASAQTSACNWPYDNNALTNGRFESDTAAELLNYQSGRRIALADHPCGWGWGYEVDNIHRVSLTVNRDPNEYIIAQWWVLPISQPTGQAYLRRIYADNLVEQPALENANQVTAGWQFVEMCLPPTTNPAKTGETVYTLNFATNATPAPSEMVVTGLVLGFSATGCEDEPLYTGTTTPEPTAVLTSTPTATATPAITPTATIAITATVTAIYIISTIAPVPTLPANVGIPPVPTLTPYPLLPPPVYTTTTPITATLPLTIPSFYADLPNLPSPVTIGNNLGVEAEIAWPEWTVADGQQILVLPVSVVSYIAESEWWEIINYGIHVIIAVLGLIRISTMF